jgi:hypothetical protein
MFDQRYAAYHEAAHAIACEAVGVAVRYVDIDQEGLGGYCRHAGIGPENVHNAPDRVTIAAAARVAEDRLQALERGEDLAPDHAALRAADIEKYRDDIADFGEDELEEGTDDYELYRVLMTLEEASDPGQARRTLEELIGNAVTVVAEHWPHIEALADQLLRERYVSGSDVSKIMETTALG